MGIGILVHGMNLTNVKGEDWEKLVFGEPPNKLGIMPTTVLELLNAFIRGDDVKAVVFGSGGSQKDGIKESEYTKRFLLEHIKELGEFLAIGTHPGFKSPEGQRFLKKHLAEIICDTSSQNTLQEVENAAAIFAKHWIESIIQISCGSHLPPLCRDSTAGAGGGENSVRTAMVRRCRRYDFRWCPDSEERCRH